ncbi:sensor histidine kinase [Flavihumibacter fluvii]|uniref:sensor histidine kinase n=1 Tax=Flavihumibacter fluvii TaxID=2838157 RepID=UPI001BDF6E2A|nr:two-component regulator propeller domain-containing protein [Flavihumibacter fluvii]ULQ52763.1 ATP-binding protein [Flavihumibacter fluvii]
MHYRRYTQGLLPIVLLLAIMAMASMQNETQAQLNPDRLMQYSEKDGLPGADVYAVMPDHAGYIWTGTINGLSRFDGYEFKRYYYNPNDSTSIKGSLIWSLFEQPNGNIWIGGVSAINRYDPVSNIFHRYAYDHLIDQPSNIETGILNINSDANGRIYFGVRINRGEGVTHGLLYYDEKDDALKRFEYPDSLVIGEVFQSGLDKFGDFWFLSNTGLFKINQSGKLVKYHGLDAELKKSNINYSGIYADHEGYLWIGLQNQQLCRLNIKTGETIFYSLQEILGNTKRAFYFNSMDSGPNQTLWFGSNFGLICFHRNTGRFEVFNEDADKKIERGDIWSVKFDAFGTLWMGTQTKGLLKYDNTSLLKTYSNKNEEKNSLSPGWANNIREISGGKILITTGGQNGTGGFNVLDPETGMISIIPNHEIAPLIWGINSVYENAPGEYIINTYRDNYLFWPATKKVEKLNLPGVPDNTVIWTFYTDNQHNFWLGSSRGLYRRSKGASTFKLYELSVIPGSNLTSNEINGILQSRFNGLWLRSNNGLFFYDYATDKIDRHGFDKTKGDVFFSQDVNAIYEDSDSILWVGTWQGGLGKYNVRTRKIKNYTTENGLPSMSIQSILGDEENGTLWMGSFDGLIRFDKKTEQSISFSIADGIQSQLFADGSAVRTSKGYFAFGGSNGITIFKPGDIAKNSIPPKVFLTDLKLFNKSVTPGEKSILKTTISKTKEITLPYDQNNITLDFLALHFGNPAKNKYAYRLENFENDWREVGSQHTAYYSKLPPGKYIFHVKAANNNGVWNEEGASLSITILPPWWMTYWAYAAYLLGFIALGFAGDRYFRHRLIEKERERNQARELEQAKEIEKAYRGLTEAHESLKATQNQLIQAEKMASLGELTAGIAHEIQNPLNFVNNFAEVNNELLGEMNDEIAKGDLDSAREVAKHIVLNNQKINEHGKRADSIVKSMLQHSQSSRGIKEKTDINSLCDEYLRLAYHGYRAKEKSFQANLVLDFDKELPMASINRQEIGRVLLNLYNNAFFALWEKRKLVNGSFEPAIRVSTKARQNGIEISIADNGSGIPEKVIGKIFQPFFTTKPTGQGTGLGLSLSYDIVKAHGGELQVDTRAGVGTTFNFFLPA